MPPELTTRGASPATLRAYRRDLLELADWATTQQREPGELAYRDLRRYAALLSERRLARTTIARKLAAARSFHAHLVTVGAAESNPADLLPATKKGSKLPRVLGPRRGRRPARPHPGAQPARDPRPRAVRARLLERPAG